MGLRLKVWIHVLYSATSHTAEEREHCEACITSPPPFEEAKLVRCTRGAIHDVIIDLRHDSKTFGKHFGATLTAENRTMFYIPKGFAHGFLTLEDDTEIYYQMSEFYAPDSARGVRWNDAAFAIEWPGEVLILSEKDRFYPDFNPKKARN